MKIIIPPIFNSKSSYAFLPLYIFESITLSVNSFNYFVVKFFLGVLRILVKIRLRAVAISSHVHRGRFLPQEVVNDIYTREAESYEWKHHCTTNFRDAWWRRTAAFHILSLAKKNSLTKIKILDLGTGIGLSLEEMLKIFESSDLNVEAVGLDYNVAMLERANKVTLPRMFNEGEFDFVTLICGAGGIHLPLEAFIEQLGVLKEGGYLIIIDIHRPMYQFDEHWPWFLRFFNTDLFQYLGWKEITLPLVLRDLWGWFDPTTLFYLLPFTTDLQNLTGFAVNYFEVISEKWWFNLPVMTTGKLILKKEKYSQV